MSIYDWYHDPKSLNHWEPGLQSISPQANVGDGIEWRKHGKLHREDDKPARISVDTHGKHILYWYKDGILHRDGDLPAAIWPSGYKEWWKNGVKVANSEEEYYNWKNKND